jgi:hypothetical protein
MRSVDLRRTAVYQNETRIALGAVMDNQAIALAGASHVEIIPLVWTKTGSGAADFQRLRLRSQRRLSATGKTPSDAAGACRTDLKPARVRRGVRAKWPLSVAG